MDGFHRQARTGRCLACHAADDPGCSLTPSAPDVMGYHDAREIPNYWAYARNFVLQDHMFEPNASWSLPGPPVHGVGWSARCRSTHDPMSCNASDPERAVRTPRPTGQAPDYAWTDLTYLLHRTT